MNEWTTIPQEQHTIINTHEYLHRKQSQKKIQKIETKTKKKKNKKKKKIISIRLKVFIFKIIHTQIVFSYFISLLNAFEPQSCVLRVGFLTCGFGGEDARKECALPTSVEKIWRRRIHKNHDKEIETKKKKKI